ncbi:MAG TPA: hypothetical protein VJ506_09240, partial [Candidatus Limnocylindrales bacterium]|nr:hypothetical protein [Candidatus Limnocylindrales bacterium]
TPSPPAPSAGATLPTPTTSPTLLPSPAPSSLAGGYRSWTRIDLPDPASAQDFGASVTGLVAFHGSYIATGSVLRGGNASLNRGVVWTSADGRTWTVHDRIAAFDGAALRGLVTDGSRLVAFGNHAGEPARATWVSLDGTDWTRSIGVAPSVVVAGPHGFIGAVTTAGPDAEGSNGLSGASVRFVQSADGLHWTGSSTTFAAYVGFAGSLARSLAVTRSGHALAVGETGTAASVEAVLLRSEDGRTWTGPARLATDAMPIAVGASGDGFLVAAWSQVWRVSPAGEAQPVAFPIEEGENVTGFFVVGDVVIALGLGPIEGGRPQAQVWLSTDGGASFDRITGQAAFGSDLPTSWFGAVVATPGGLLAVGSWDDPASVRGGFRPAAWLASR